MNADRSARQLLSPPVAPAPWGVGSAAGVAASASASAAGAPRPPPRSPSRAALAAPARVTSLSLARHHALARTCAQSPSSRSGAALSLIHI
eukprot:1558471-Pleurochrysis_carterae.AAC.1